MPTEYSANLMTTTEMLTHVVTDIATASLQRIMDAEEESMVKLYGAHAADDSTAASVSEKFTPLGQNFINLGREASSITSVVETVSSRYGTTDTTLSANDYELWNSRQLRRLATGDNARTEWKDIVTVVYAPYDDRASRRRVLIDLVKLALSYNAVNSETIGEISASYPDYDKERRKLLSSLDDTGFVFA